MSTTRYVELMSRRKEALFKGDEKQAERLLELAEKLAESGRVSDDEFIAAAYL